MQSEEYIISCNLEEHKLPEPIAVSDLCTWVLCFFYLQTLATWARHGLRAHQDYLALWLTVLEKLFRQVTVGELVFGFKVNSWIFLQDLMHRAFNISIPADGKFVGLMNDVSCCRYDVSNLFNSLNENHQ